MIDSLSLGVVICFKKKILCHFMKQLVKKIKNCWVNKFVVEYEFENQQEKWSYFVSNILGERKPIIK